MYFLFPTFYFDEIFKDSLNKRVRSSLLQCNNPSLQMEHDQLNKLLIISHFSSTAFRLAFT